MYQTYNEYLNTPGFIKSKSIAMKRDGFKCVDCGDLATEVHHVKYCKWGEIDPPENMVAICNQCHCERHRCLSCSKVKLKAKHIKSGSVVCDTCRSTQEN